jgi:hypothetical protein
LFQQDGKFPHPNSYIANGMKPKPQIFEVFPEAAAMMSDYMLCYLDHFAAEMLRNEFITNHKAILQSCVGYTFWDIHVIN